MLPSSSSPERSVPPLHRLSTRTSCQSCRMRCQGCHRPGEAAPMSFLTYKETRPWAAAIREAVSTRKMPPWHADPAHGTFRNRAPPHRRRDRDAEPVGEDRAPRRAIPRTRRLLVSSPRAGPSASPTWCSTWERTTRSRRAEPSSTPISSCPPGSRKTSGSRRSKCGPTARSGVHHAVLFSRPPGSKFVGEAKPGCGFRPRTRQGDQAGDRAEPRVSSSHLTGARRCMSIYVPGGDAYQVRPGQARLLKAGSDLVFQMHYTAQRQRGGRPHASRNRVREAASEGARDQYRRLEWRHQDPAGRRPIIARPPKSRCRPTSNSNRCSRTCTSAARRSRSSPRCPAESHGRCSRSRATTSTGRPATT